MPESNSTESRKRMLSTISVIIEENESFLYDHANDAYRETINLTNDFIINYSSAQPNIRTPSGYSESSLAFFLIHMLSPFSIGIYTSLIIGNLPGCFMTLRLLTESLATCLVADQQYKQISQFTDRLRSLQESHRPTSDILKKFDKSANCSRSILELWKRLSTDWLHTPKYAIRLADTISKTGTAPSWSLVIPNSYKDEDLELINELGTSISYFREIMNNALSQWQLL